MGILFPIFLLATFYFNFSNTNSYFEFIGKCNKQRQLIFCSTTLHPQIFLKWRECDSVALQSFEECRQLWNHSKYFQSDNQLSFFLVSNSTQNLVNFVFEMNNIQDSWRQTGQKHLFWMPVIYLVWPERSKSSLSLQKSFHANFESNSLNLHPDTLVTILATLQNGHKIIWDIYHKNTLLEIPQGSSQIDILLLGALAARRSLDKVHLKVVGVYSTLEPHNVSMRKVNSTTVEFLKGLAVELLWTLRDALHFKIIGTYADDKMIEKDGGGLGGVGEEIENGHSDLCVSLHTPIPYRVKHVTFLQPVHPENLMAYFRQPPKSALRNIFLLPFSPHVWLVIGLSFFGVLIFFMIIDYLSKFLDIDPLRQLDDIILWTMAAFCLQNLEETQVRRSEPRRIVFTSTFIMTTILYLYYAGSIVSVLTLDLSPVTTFQHLLDYGYIVMSNEHIRNFMMGAISQETSKPEIIKAVENSGLHYVNDEDAIHKALQRNPPFYATMRTDDIFHQLVMKLNISDEHWCQLSKIRFGSSKGMLAMSIQKGSPYKEFLNTKTALIIERGLKHLFQSRHNRLINPPCPSKSQKSVGYEELGFSDFFVVVKLMIFGGMAAITIFVVEFVFSQSRRSLGGNLRERDYITTS